MNKENSKSKSSKSSNFLIKENEVLRLQLLEMKENLKFNKELIWNKIMVDEIGSKDILEELKEENLRLADRIDHFFLEKQELEKKILIIQKNYYSMISVKNKELESVNEDLFHLNQKVSHKESSYLDIKKHYDQLLIEKSDYIASVIYVTEPSKLALEFHNELKSSRSLVSTLTRQVTYLGKKIEKMKFEMESIRKNKCQHNLCSQTTRINNHDIEYNESPEDSESILSSEFSFSSNEIDSPVSYLGDKVNSGKRNHNADTVTKGIPKLNFNLVNTPHKKFGSYAMPKPKQAKDRKENHPELEEKIHKLNKAVDKNKGLYLHLKDKYNKLKAAYQKQKAKLREYKALLKTPQLTSKSNNKGECMENNFEIDKITENDYSEEAHR